MKNQFLVFLGGAIAGAAVALLLAPKSGEELREDIRGYVDEEVKKGRKLLDQSRRKVSDVSHRVADAVCETAEDMADKADKMAQKAERAVRKVERAAKKI